MGDKNYFAELNGVNGDHIEQKNRLNYLSWTWAWGGAEGSLSFWLNGAVFRFLWGCCGDVRGFRQKCRRRLFYFCLRVHKL